MRYPLFKFCWGISVSHAAFVSDTPSLGGLEDSSLGVKRQRQPRSRPRPRRSPGTTPARGFDGAALTAAQMLDKSPDTLLDLQSALQEGTMRVVIAPGDDPTRLEFDSSSSSADTEPTWEYRSLAQVTGSQDLARHFRTDADFRTDLRMAMRSDIFAATPAYQGLSEKAVSCLMHPETSLQGSWKRKEAELPGTSKVLLDKGISDVSGAQLLTSIGTLCDEEPSTHWMDIVGVRDRVVRHSFHQDTANVFRKRRTVLWGFPPENDYTGTGVFSHVVPLLCSCSAPSQPSPNEPVVYEGSAINASVVRPVFGPEQELIVYRDANVLHSSPDVAYRESVMRFM